MGPVLLPSVLAFPPPTTTMWPQNLLTLLLCLWLTSLRLPNAIPSGLRGLLHRERGCSGKGLGW